MVRSQRAGGVVPVDQVHPDAVRPLAVVGVRPSLGSAR